MRCPGPRGIRYHPDFLPGAGFAVIRFRCTTCEREYVLADALAHLPLLCKGCGHRLTVPEPQVEVPHEAKPAFDRSLPPADDGTFRGFGDHSPEVHDSVVDLFPSAETRAKLGLSLPPEPVPLRNPVPTPADEPAPQRKTLAIVADVVVAIVLLAIGMLVGEAVVGKSTGQILSNVTGPTFPPTDLLLWLGCIAFFGLIYVWLGTRGWTLGGWLKRRQG